MLSVRQEWGIWYWWYANLVLDINCDGVWLRITHNFSMGVNFLTRHDCSFLWVVVHLIFWILNMFFLAVPFSSDDWWPARVKSNLLKKMPTIILRRPESHFYHQQQQQLPLISWNCGARRRLISMMLVRTILTNRINTAARNREERS